MTASGDAAEQVVRMSLEGMEVAAKITGNGAKNLAVLLATVLKEEQKTKGKARLSSMLKSGKELKVFSVRQKDLAKFSKEAKRYGVLYCVLKDRSNTDENAMVDVIARAEDASKIQRITERFKLATIDTATVRGSIEKEKGEAGKANGRAEDGRTVPASDAPERGARIMRPAGKAQERNPNMARTGNAPLSEPDSKQASRSSGSIRAGAKPSVRKKLEGYRIENERAKKEAERIKSETAKGAVPAAEAAAKAAKEAKSIATKER